MDKPGKQPPDLAATEFSVRFITMALIRVTLLFIIKPVICACSYVFLYCFLCVVSMGFFFTIYQALFALK